MAKGQKKITISWSDENEELLKQIAETDSYARNMAYNGILPYTNTTGEKEPNASGIIRYLLLEALGKTKRLR